VGNGASRHVLVTDFDGTMTDNDIYLLIARDYLPQPLPDYFEGYRAGRVTHFEAMRSYFAHGPKDERGWLRLLDEAAADPELGETLGRLQSAGWEVVVASAGSSWYIERILERAGVSGVAVHANPGTLRHGCGLWIELPRQSPFFSRDAGIDKPAIVRDALARADVVAFAGDGPPDLDSILLVNPEFRFARGWLARELTRRGEPFREFRRWSDAARALAAVR
jgi:2-hydroxy-3-keto-5-methylthiopentenyl-1-phosphate phosphatase